MNTSTKNKAYIALAITSIIWGSTWIASKIGVQKTPGLQLSYIRQFIAGCLFLGFYFIKGEKLPTLKQFKWLIILALLMFVFANGLSTWSVKYIPSGLAALVGALYPLSVVIIEMIFFKNRNTTLLTFIGLILGILGVAVVFYENAFQQHPEGYGFGISLAVAAMLSWSVGSIFLTTNKVQINPYYAMGWQMFLGSIMIYIMAQITHQSIPLKDIPYESWLAIAYLIVFGSLIAFVAFIFSMKHLPVAISSLYAYFNPIVAMLIGSVIVNEKLTIYIVVGAIITLFGVYLVNKSMKKLK